MLVAPNNQEVPCEDVHVYICGNCSYTETCNQIIRITVTHMLFHQFVPL